MISEDTNMVLSISIADQAVEFAKHNALQTR